MDAKQSMQTPSAPKFDGNTPAALSTGVEGRAIMPSCAVAAVSGPSRDGTTVVAQPSPLQSRVGLLAPVQGLEVYGSGAPRSQQPTGTPDTKFTNVRPDGPPTPGY